MGRMTSVAAVCVAAGWLLASAATVPAGAEDCRQRGRTRARQTVVPRDSVTIDADVIQRRDDDRILIFTGGVVARRHDLLQCADRFEVYFDGQRTSIVRTVAIGNVRVITGDCREGAARRAEFRDQDQRLVLSGNARLSPDEGWPRGDDIFIYLPTSLTSPWRCGAAATDPRGEPR